jgi:putative ABC transport system substrate-binding protein
MVIRSTLIIVLAFVLLVAPLAGGAQQAGKVYRMGWISGLAPGSAPHLSAAMIQALRDLGWVEGQNLVIDYGYAEGRFDRLPALVVGLLRAKPDVILAQGDQPIKAAKEATATVPIVMIACDAVAAGLIVSLARPGGNITGVTCISREIAGKRIELLRESLPHLDRLAVLYNPDDPGKAIEWRETEVAGRALGRKVTAVPIRDPKEFQGAFAAITQERTDGLIILGDPFTILHGRALVDLAAKHRLPTMAAYGEFVTSGALMSYGPNLVEMRRMAAVYIDKVLRGARPADLPVEQPRKFELIVNLKVAKALGLTIPQALLQRADQVIQ